MVHSHDGVSFSHNEERNDAICSSLDGPRDYHSEYSKSDKHHTISLIGGKKMLQMQLQNGESQA